MTSPKSVSWSCCECETRCSRYKSVTSPATFVSQFPHLKMAKNRQIIRKSFGLNKYADKAALFVFTFCYCSTNDGTMEEDE